MADQYGKSQWPKFEKLIEKLLGEYIKAKRREMRKRNGESEPYDMSAGEPEQSAESIRWEAESLIRLLSRIKGESPH